MKNKRWTHRALACALISSTTLLACQEKKQLTEMHDSTTRMEHTTGEMNKTTTDVKELTERMQKTTDKMLDQTGQVVELTKGLTAKTDSMKTTTEELYDALRQGNALQLRREAWQSVLIAPTLFRRISEAGKYFMSFEFQLWNQLGQDADLEKRWTLAHQAALEFYLEIEELGRRDDATHVTAEPQPTQVTSQENRMASFNALAIALDQMNRKQLPILEQNRSLSPMNMLTLTEEALWHKHSNSKKPLSPFQAKTYREILAHEAKALQLIETRYSLLPLMMIDATAKISDKSLLGKARMLLFGWTLDLDQLNSDQVEYYHTELLEKSLQARRFLQSLGRDPELDPIVTRLLQKMKIRAAQIDAGPTAVLKTKFIGLIQELLGHEMQRQKTQTPEPSPWLATGS